MSTDKPRLSSGGQSFDESVFIWVDLWLNVFRVEPLAPGSKPVKAGQTDMEGQASGLNPYKSMKINDLQNKQLWVGQTMINLVNMVKINQSASELAQCDPAVLTVLCLRLFPLLHSSFIIQSFSATTSFLRNPRHAQHNAKLLLNA